MDYVKRILQALKRPRYFVPAILALVVLFIICRNIFFKNDNSTLTTEVAMRTTVAQEVTATGNVKAAETVNLGFGNSGTIANIYSSVGKEVTKGQMLAELNTNDLYAQLKQAQSNLALQLAQTQNTTLNADQVKKQQDTLVANAYRTLLSDKLAAVPYSDSYTATPPVISGAYNGAEGTYEVDIDKKNITDIDFQLRTYNLENTGNIKIQENEPTRLGTRGLYISFPDALSNYINTQWYITIPNTKSSTYVTNENNYISAQANRDKAIADAQAQIDTKTEGSTVSQAQIASAQAGVQSVEAKLENSRIVAPIKGIITQFDAKVGQFASPGVTLISIISDSNLEVEVDVPEADIAKVAIGASASITFDAYGRDLVAPATVTSIDPAAVMIEGVPTYRTVLQFNAPDARIKSGMTANITIKGQEKDNVIAVLQRAVITNENGKFVQVLVGKKVEERPVTTGLRGSDGNIEITSGLNEGDVVITSNLAK